MLDKISSSEIQRLSDRLAIEEVLARYCRGIDRCDGDELAAVFTADASIDYGDGPKPPSETIAGLMAGLGTMRLTQHNIGNIICKIDGERAKCETYCVALHIIPQEGKLAHDTEMVVGGRYLDTLVKQAGRWKIAERLYVMDWNRQGKSSMEMSGGLYDTLARRGSRFPDDPSYAWWQKEPAD